MIHVPFQNPFSSRATRKLITFCLPALQFIACVIVFTAMNFLKVLFAKLLSSYFHSSTHFVKMQEALDKVRACVCCLLQMVHRALLL